ncbi:asparaginase, partial [Candidatus Roizmanbacteria bacterium]|nr:asparaginase [Candidatus Roizmanbacteria bacterium]
MKNTENQETVPLRRNIGLFFAGGTVFATVNKDGFREGKQARELVEFVQSEFPGMQLPLSQPSEVPFLGLSENIEFVVLGDIEQAISNLIARPDVGSVVGTHGTDTLEQTGTHL